MKIIKNYCFLLLILSTQCLAGYWSTITNSGSQSGTNLEDPITDVFLNIIEDIELADIEFSSYKIEVRFYDIESYYLEINTNIVDRLAINNSQVEASIAFEFETLTEQQQFENFVNANIWNQASVGFWLAGNQSFLLNNWTVDRASALISEAGGSAPVWDGLFTTKVSRDANGAPLLNGNNNPVLIDTTHTNDYFWEMDWQFETDVGFDKRYIFYSMDLINVGLLDYLNGNVDALQFVIELDEFGNPVDQNFPYVIESANDPRNLMPSEIRFNMQVEAGAGSSDADLIQMNYYYFFDNQSATLAMDQYMLDESHIDNHVGETSLVDKYLQFPELIDYAKYKSLHDSVDNSHFSTENEDLGISTQLLTGSGFFQTDIVPLNLNFITAASSNYSLSGVVSGLSDGDSVTLQNNSMDDELVVTDGAFTFDTLIPNGFDYDVTVLTQPVQSNHLCLVSGGNSGNDNGTGNITNANDSSITITCTLNCESQQSGLWSDSNTWMNCNNGIPQDGYSVIINDLHTVILNQDTALLESLTVAVGGDFNVSGNYSLNADAEGADIDLQNATTELAGDLTINSNAHDVLLGAVDGAFGLVINNTSETRFKDTVGDTTPLTSVLTDAGGNTIFDDVASVSVNTANFSVNGSRVFNDPVLLANNITMSGIGGDIIFNNTIDSESTRKTLAIKSVNGDDIFFNKDIGVSNLLNSVNIFNSNGSIVNLNLSTVQTFSSQVYKVNVLINSPTNTVNLESSNNNNIVFGKTNNTNYLRSEATTPDSLIITTGGTIQLRSLVGDNNQPLKDLTINPASSIELSTSTIAVNDTITFNGPTLLSKNASLNAVSADLNGDVDNAGFDLTLNTSGTSPASTIDGDLSGEGDLIKEGAGALSFNSINALSGNVTLNQGNLQNNTTSAELFPNIGVLSMAENNFTELGDTVSNNFQLNNNQSVIGNFVCDCNLIANNGSTISPGFSPGIFLMEQLSMNTGSNLSIDIDGTTAGTGYDEIILFENASLDADSLGGATLDINFGFAPSIGDSFNIVDSSSGITGTFNGLPEGSQFVVDNKLLSMTYVGGSNNNDAVITYLGSSIIHVDQDAAPGGDGQSWLTAYDNLQDALSVAVTGMEIWVAEGVYYPDEGNAQFDNDETSTFTLQEGVNVYGGFSGNETALSQRDPKANISILSGDIDGDDINADTNNIAESVADIQGSNAYHVLNGQSVTLNTLVDGFTVTAGNAILINPFDTTGGGMYCNETGGPSINKLIFIGNYASARGGATNNCAGNVTNSQYISNQSNLGGAAYIYGEGYFENVSFKGNSSNLEAGGAIANYKDLTLINVLFSGNASADDGGAVFIGSTGGSYDFELINVTITGNKSTTSGAGLKIESAGTLDIYNSIIWNNQYGVNNGTADASIDSGITVNNINSLIQGFGTTGSGNLDEDPIFITNTDPTTAPTILGNAHLNVGSPAIETGDNNAVVTILTDLDGNPRITDLQVDMGAYAFSSYGIEVNVLGLGAGSLVLQNNGEDDLTIFTNDVHNFSTAVANTANYLVTVLTQPTNPNQSCEITDGSGTIDNGSVELDVNCTTIKYNVGVGVTGLADGVTLSLILNSLEHLNVTTNGLTNFATSLDDSSAYAVSISAQPNNPNQICSITSGNASGNLAGSDEVLTVECTTVQYNIGVDVSGLAAGNAMELNNSLEDLIVSSNGQFNFATTIDDGSEYDVTVLAQPTTPNQVCSVIAGTGTLQGADVIISVTCTTNQYFVGGMASGLASGNLVTLSLGAEDLEVNNNNAFVFLNPLSDESSYSVSVTTQPTSPNQTCDLLNSSGTITGNDITDMEVNCTINQYRVGGTVTGLHSGNRLVVQNNDGDDLIILRNGDFVFVGTIEDLQLYNVTILDQPSNPIQTCVLSNNIGNVSGNHVINVSIVCEFGEDLIYKDDFE